MTFFTKRQTAGSRPDLRGFGLIELLVSISIMVLVTTIVLAGQSAFNGSVLVRSQAYEIALRLREVQLSAVGAMGVSTSGSNNFRTLYGAQFNTNSTTYTVFSTPNVTGNWHTANTFVQTGALGIIDQRFAITNITAVPNTGASTTLTGNAYVVFNRPNFDARFFRYDGNELTGVNKLVISIGPRGSTYPNSNERTVVITSAGQISVE